MTPTTSQSEHLPTCSEDTASDGMQFLLLNPPFMMWTTKACCAAKNLERQDSGIETTTDDSVSETSEASVEMSEIGGSKLTGSWTTVSQQKTLFAESAPLKASQKAARAANPEAVIHPALRYRSNAVVDLWWPSPFLEAGVVRDVKETMPPLSWRDRVSMGSWCAEVSPAFWGEAVDEDHLR